MRAMLKRHTARIAVVILLLLFAACGGGTSVAPDLAGSSGEQLQQATPATDGLPQRNRLVASMPSPAGLGTGDEFEFTLRCELAKELYQCSGRIVFDPAVVEPVAANWGAMVPGDAVTLAKLNEPGMVPFAFTALPGYNGAAAGTGELLRVRFRLKGEPARGLRIRLRNDAEFLQLRNRIGRRLAFDLANEVTP